MDLAASEIINNLKQVRISEEIEDIRTKMMEYEKNKDAGGKIKDDIVSKYDELYQRLVELEKEKMNLKII
jgi:predicted nuclease with TOPRIM domain